MAAYRRCRDALVAQSLAPAPETDELYRHILGSRAAAPNSAASAGLAHALVAGPGITFDAARSVALKGFSCWHKVVPVVWDSAVSAP